jgi:hypothetical protein
VAGSPTVLAALSGPCSEITEPQDLMLARQALLLLEPLCQPLLRFYHSRTYLGQEKT